MKKVLLTMAALAFTVSVFAQGTVIFNNNLAASGVKALVYGPEGPAGTPASYISKTGNTAEGTPPGTQTYAGALLTGTGYLAQILAANGANQAESSLQAASSAPSWFRAGVNAGGILQVVTTLSNVPKDAAAATLQVVAWDNSSGKYPTWASVQADWQIGLVAAGKSLPFNVNGIGGDLNPQPYLAGMTSFNIYYIPEPSTMALLGLGAAALLIFRRRK